MVSVPRCQQPIRRHLVLDHHRLQLAPELPDRPRRVHVLAAARLVLWVLLAPHEAEGAHELIVAHDLAAHRVLTAGEDCTRERGGGTEACVTPDHPQAVVLVAEEKRQAGM